MHLLLIYLLKQAISLIVFTLFFKLFFTKDTFFGFNRIVLCLGVIVCCILPAINISTQELSVIQEPFLHVENAIKQSDNIIPAENIDIEKTHVVSTEKSRMINNLNPLSVLLIIYAIGIFASIVYLWLSYRSMMRIIKRGKIQYHKNDYILITVDEDISPFSWRKYIVLSDSDYKEYAEEIMMHELAHIKCRHTIDNLLMEILCLIQWFNPTIWILRKELKSIHEYQADMSVLKTGIDATKYQLLLVKKAVGAYSYNLANGFNHSKIKKRITMMLKEKSNNWARLKLLMVLPLLILTLYAFARPEVKQIETQIQNEEPEFCFPLKSSRKTSVTAEYGTRNSRRHIGCDIKGVGRDTIYAAFSGIVSVSEKDRVKGNYIVIEHANGLKTVYAHNSQNMVNAQARVKAGDPIGITGSTGRSTGDHLHFEVWKNDASINPQEYIDFDSKELKNRSLLD